MEKKAEEGKKAVIKEKKLATMQKETEVDVEKSAPEKK